MGNNMGSNMHRAEITELLDSRSIEYEIYEHRPIKTVTESQDLGLPHQQWATKNFFLRDKKKKNYFIITTQENKKIDLKDIRNVLGTSALSFASDEDLDNMLGIVSGAVSPFGALNDESMKVRVYIDRLFEGNLMDAHPNDNSATMFLKADDVISVIRESGRTAEYIDLPDGIKILTSMCLYGGEAVRYDGKSKAETDPVYIRWKEEGRLIPVCPEVFGGLSVPRPDAQIKDGRVINREGTDVTAEYTKGANEAVRLAKEHGAAFAVMKEKSPSCGSNMIYDGSFTGKMIPGQGLAVRMLREEGIKVFSEEELEEADRYIRQIKGEE